MRKLLTILLIFLTTSALAQQKPILGEQINWAHPLSKGLVSLWLFNEGSGNKVFDLSGNGNDGTFAAGGASPSWLAGKFGSALDFDGGDYVDLGQGPNNNLDGCLAITMLMWFKADAVPAADYEYILYADVDLTKTGWGLSFKDSQLRVVGRSWAGDDFQSVSTSFTDTTSRHCVVGINDYAGDYQYLYLDGVLANSGAATFGKSVYTLGTPDHVCAIGARPADKLIDGQIDCTMIFNHILSTSEIALLYRDPFCMFEKDDIAIMEASIPEAGGGQIIIIQMAAIPLFLIPILIFIRRQRG